MNIGRRYDNSLRTEQASATRERIIDAAITVLGRGPEELSMPAVAGEAGVSVPTVYRNFASKKALVDAIYDRYVDTIDVRWEETAPDDLEDLLGRVARVFAKQDRVPAPLRAAMSGPTGRRARRQNMPGRRAETERLLAPFELDEEDRARLQDLVIILTSGVVQKAFRDYFGAGPAVAADRVTWAIRRLATAGSSAGRRGD